MNRRELLKASATTIAGLGLVPGMASFMQSCREEPARGTDTYLSDQLFSQLRAISDTILPKTETPGALDAGVPEFIDSLFRGYFDNDQMEIMIAGLESLQKSCMNEYGEILHELPDASRHSFLSNQFESNDFLPRLKSLITWAYFTSETGMKALNYQPIPGKFEGCVPANSTTKLNVGNRA